MNHLFYLWTIKENTMLLYFAAALAVLGISDGKRASVCNTNSWDWYILVNETIFLFAPNSRTNNILL